MKLFFAISLLLSLSKPVFAESVPSPQLIGLLKYCSILEGEQSSYQDKLNVAQKVFDDNPKEFFECFTDTDCIITTGACGETVPVAYMAKSCFNEAASLYGAVIDCELVKENKAYKPACIERKCILNSE